MGTKYIISLTCISMLILTTSGITLNPVTLIKNTLWHFVPKPKIPNDGANLKTPEILKQRGYPVEIHELETPDGHILQMHRIPHGPEGPNGKEKRIPVLVHNHLVSTGSATWLFFERSQSLVYLLVDAGYDVWLGNFRVTEYSHHKKLPSWDHNYWRFSLHELGVYDMANMIDYVIAHTGYEKIFQVVTKFGNLPSFILLSAKPEYNDKLIMNVALAPFWQLKPDRVNDIIHGLVEPIRPFVHPLLDLIRGDLFISRSFLKGGLRFVAHHWKTFFTEATIALTGDYESKDFNETRTPELLGNLLGGASTRPIHHLLSIVEGLGVNEYDWSPDENLARYGKVVVQPYDLSKVTVPTLLVYSKSDVFLGQGEAELIAAKIKNPTLIPVNKTEWTSFHFYAAITGKELIYDNLIERMNQAAGSAKIKSRCMGC